MITGSFDKILQEASGVNLKQMQLASTGWFKEQLKQIHKNRFNKYQFIAQGQQYKTKRMEIGKMYMFEYFPKHVNSLPVWDRYPLIIPFNTAPQGFVGINFHYLPHKIRAWLLNQLLRNSNDRTNKLYITWELLSKFSRANVGEYATHRYLLSHVTSPFRLIPIEDYSKAILLPMASWYGNDKRAISKFRRQI